MNPRNTSERPSTGRGFGRFLQAALIGAGVSVAAALAVLGHGCSRAPSTTVPAASTAVGGASLFEEAGQQLGLTFVHDSGSKGEYMMPEHIGSGAAFLDYDNDGLLDIYLVQCGGPHSQSKNQLFHHEPDGRFKNVSEGSHLDVAAYGMGATAADVNNDGRVDLFLTEYGGVRLFLNRGGGQFEDVTIDAGIDNGRWSTAASFLDYDRDGWLDLVIGNYVDYNPTEKCFAATEQPDFCGPQNFQPTASKLYHNLGSTPGPGKVAFEDVTVSSGFAKALGKALGILCADFDGDGWPDIFVADDGAPNRLYINQRNGAFKEEAALRGLAYNAMGATAGNMGIALNDANHDGFFDLFITHLAHEQHALWLQGPPGLFQDRTAASGLVNLGRRGTGFGTVLGDFNVDGAPDLAVVNGAIRRGSGHPGNTQPGLLEFWRPYAQRYQLFLNDGTGAFTDVSAANPTFCENTRIGRGLACADYDNDGALDLLAVCAGGPVQLFHNIAPRRGHWLTVRAIDPAAGGRDAIGAEVVVRSASRSWWGLVQPSSSYLVSNDPRAHFGLGPVEQLVDIRIRWPDGRQEGFPAGLVDRHLVLRKGQGQPL